jgi:hypothetical protein
MTAAIGPIIGALAEGGGTAAGLGETFGAATEADAWGGAVEGDEMESIPGHDMDVGGGHSLQLNPEQIAEFLHSDESIAALMELAQMVTNSANDNAQIPDAQYEFIIQTTDGYVTPQALVMAANYRGVLDEAAHSTLLVAAGEFESSETVLTSGVALTEDNPTL